jgi:hypothetical protein
MPVVFPMRKVIACIVQRSAAPFGTRFKMECDVPSGMSLADEAVHLRDKINLMGLALTVEIQEKGWKIQEPPATAGGEG